MLLCNVTTLCLISLYTHPLSGCMMLITQRAYLNIFDFIRFFFSSYKTPSCVFLIDFFISPWIKRCDVLPLKLLSKPAKIKQHFNVFGNRTYMWKKKIKRKVYAKCIILPRQTLCFWLQVVELNVLVEKVNKF